MRYNIRLKNTILILAIFFALNGYAYNWPLTNGTVQYQINATFGECRGTRDHFHNGLDIQATQGTAVLAIEGGTAYISAGSAGVSIGHYRYYHLTNIAVQNQQTITAGTVIGYTDGGNHIHFIECTQVISFYGDVPNNLCSNPLINGGLTPFADKGDPVIDNVTVYRQGTNDIVQLGTFYGQLDFAVQAHDPGVTSTGGANIASTCGIYSVSIEFRDGNNDLIGQPINYLNFNNLPNNTNINWAFANGTNSSTFIYWATNDPFNGPYNKYWNTRQRVNSNFDVDARYAGEALYNEGVISIRVVVEDVAGNRTTRELTP